jgi:hypothetical protein
MTGQQIAEAARIPVFIGAANAYCWWGTKYIVLRGSVAVGTGPWAQLCAAHEVAHHAQNLELPWLRWMRWFEPIRWWSELDAWRRAIEALA